MGQVTGHPLADWSALEHFHFPDPDNHDFYEGMEGRFSGTEDKLAVPRYQDYLHEQIPGSKLIRFDNAGHLLNLEKPKDVNKAIEEFVDSLPKD